jgi:hypothetical protein
MLIFGFPRFLKNVKQNSKFIMKGGFLKSLHANFDFRGNLGWCINNACHESVDSAVAVTASLPKGL